MCKNTETGVWEECSNQEVVEQIQATKKDPDFNYGYRKMTVQLMCLGYLINHKKTYRLMKENDLLNAYRKFSDKTYVKYRTVVPERPLEVLEMDIKQVWITQDRRHAYILSIIDTFTRVVLHWLMAYSITQEQVKKAWETVIVNYLQPADLLNQELHIELRNDNDSRFSAKDIQAFFLENEIQQVFTHPYTPQENGHVESFHKIMATSIKGQVFWSFQELEDRMKIFYHKYNNQRLHGSIANLWPMKFWELWEQNKIKIIEKKNKKRTFKLLIPYHQISGNENLREVSCSNPTPLNGVENLQLCEADGPETLLTTSV